MEPCGVCFPGPAAMSGQPTSRQSSRHHQPDCASLQAGPEGHHEVVPGGIIAELKCCLAGTAMPIQVVRDLPGRAHCTMCEDKWSWPRRFCSQCHVTRWALAAPSWSLWWCFPGTEPGWRYWAVWRPCSCQKCMQDLPSHGAMKTERPDATVHSIAAGVWQNHRWSRPGHFPRSWNCWNSPLNQVLCGVLMPAVVQDGIHVKVVRWHDLHRPPHRSRGWCSTWPPHKRSPWTSGPGGLRPTDGGSCSSWPGPWARGADDPGLPPASGGSEYRCSQTHSALTLFTIRGAMPMVLWCVEL